MRKAILPVSAELRLEYTDPNMHEIYYVMTLIRNVLDLTPRVYVQGQWGILPSRYPLISPCGPWQKRLPITPFI